MQYFIVSILQPDRSSSIPVKLTVLPWGLSILIQRPEADFLRSEHKGNEYNEDLKTKACFSQRLSFRKTREIQRVSCKVPIHHSLSFKSAQQRIFCMPSQAPRTFFKQTHVFYFTGVGLKTKPSIQINNHQRALVD